MDQKHVEEFSIVETTDFINSVEKVLPMFRVELHVLIEEFTHRFLIVKEEKQNNIHIVIKLLDDFMVKFSQLYGKFPKIKDRVRTQLFIEEGVRRIAVFVDYISENVNLDMLIDNSMEIH